MGSRVLREESDELRMKGRTGQMERWRDNNNADFYIGHTPEIQINALYNTNINKTNM